MHRLLMEMQKTDLFLDGSVFIKYLDNLGQEWGNSKMFVFCRPQILSSDKSHAEEEDVQYIANVMKRAKGKQLYFVPYSDGKHWMLCIIHPLKDQAYWLDPAGNEAHSDVKNVVQMAIRKFYSQRRKKKPRGKTQWSEIKKCPRQINDSDSGYYILRYMQEIIERRQDFIPEENLLLSNCCSSRKDVVPCCSSHCCSSRNL